MFQHMRNMNTTDLSAHLALNMRLDSVTDLRYTDAQIEAHALQCANRLKSTLVKRHTTSTHGTGWLGWCKR